MPAKHGVTTNQYEYLSYTMVKPSSSMVQVYTHSGLKLQASLVIYTRSRVLNAIDTQ